ncbi:SAG family member [Eimeria brunetti]|uniref:SAG family member n=1 Tax=Eimeria brunetti TaxID=51314 RepID=U6L5J2_9EIME|nr:SAG family member [Eimeria brunetti]
MAPVKFLSLACASALLVAQANTQGAKGLNAGSSSGGTVTYTAALGKETVCLSDLNDARVAAGLANFVTTADDLKWPAIKDSGDMEEGDPWLPVCQALIPKDESNAETRNREKAAFGSGTYAFMALNSDQADCTAAVDHWKAAFSNFTSIPPSKAQAGDLYKQHNLSFVALYNPKDGAAADCRVVTCTQKTAGGEPERAGQGETGGKEGYALLCMTTPDAFTDKDTAPFTEDQWSKIKTSLTGSAAAVAPSLLAFATVALGLAAL